MSTVALTVLARITSDIFGGLRVLGNNATHFLNMLHRNLVVRMVRACKTIAFRTTVAATCSAMASCFGKVVRKIRGADTVGSRDRNMVEVNTSGVVVVFRGDLRCVIRQD
jgi:hypothetical protein